MSDPIVFISHSRIKQGELEALKRYAQEIAPVIERGKPGTVVFLAYTDEAGSELHMVHAFPDADAMRRHLEGVDERVAAASELIETTGYEIYGSPSKPVLETMRAFAAELGVPLTVRPSHLGGYVRPSATG
jgi:quinol monooxygenase YgiN